MVIGIARRRKMGITPEQDAAKRNEALLGKLQGVNEKQAQIESQLAAYQNEFNEGNGANTNQYYILGSELQKIKDQKPALLKDALNQGVDLRPFYGETYADAVRFKQDLGQYGGKDVGMIIPANPVGYKGDFKFDPNFGSAYYRDLATEAGKALGLSENQILKKGTEYFADKFASGNTKGVIGFTDFGKGLLDDFAVTAGVPKERLDELRGTALKPLYEANNKVFEGLNGAARIESQSSGFFKGIGGALSKLGPIGTIGLGLALGPAGLGLASAAGAGAIAGGLPGLLQGDLESALKGGAIGGIGGGALKGLDGVAGSVSEALGGGALGNIAGNAALGSIKGGIGSLVSGGDLGQGLLGGALTGGVNAGINQGANAIFGQTGSWLDKLRRENAPLGSGISQGAGGQGLNLGDPNSFGPQFDLPNTTGYLNFMNGIGGLFDGMDFAKLGLDPRAISNLDFGSGLGQGLQNPSSPTLPGGLGQGLTVGVPGGTLGQGGVTPTGQINLGNPNSFINGGTEGVSGTGPDIGRLIKGLLGVGGAAALAKGIGSMNGGSNPQQPSQPGPSTLATTPTALNRDLGFEFQAPQYAAGLGGQGLQLPQYSILNPQAAAAPSYLRGFAEGGEIQAMNGGLGSIPMSGRFLQGPGDGMSDSIPANIDGEEDVMLTDGEYIIPAQAVSALGNGSSKAGAQVLDAMVNRVYKEQTGKPKQMKPINKKVLPA